MAACSATACLLAALGLAALGRPDPLQDWPLALHAMPGQPHAALFAWLGFIVPGTAWMVAAWCWRRVLGDDAPWPLRLAAQLLLLAAAGWLGQGLWPLDADNFDGPAGQRHALTWTLWWLAAGSAGWLVGYGFWRLRQRVVAALAGVLAAAGWLAVHAAPVPLSPAVAEALAASAWALGMLLLWRAPLLLRALMAAQP